MPVSQFYESGSLIIYKLNNTKENLYNWLSSCLSLEVPKQEAIIFGQNSGQNCCS